MDAYHLPTGTIIVREPAAVGAAASVALYARVSSAEQKDDMDDMMRQLQRLRDYAAARGYHVIAEVTEIATNLTDARPQLTKLLADTRVGVIVVEHQERLARFGYGYIATLLEAQGRRVEAVFPTQTDDDGLGDDWGDDVVAAITSVAARRSGRRNSKRRSERIQACVKHCIEQAEEI